MNDSYTQVNHYNQYYPEVHDGPYTDDNNNSLFKFLHSEKHELNMTTKNALKILKLHLEFDCMPTVTNKVIRNIFINIYLKGGKGVLGQRQSFKLCVNARFGKMK